MKGLPSIRKIMVRGFAAAGVAAILLVGTGLVLDARAIDSTRGGYEPPYTDYTGTPFDWSRADRSSDGLVYRGRIVNVLLDCTTGMMTLEVFGAGIPWRKPSPRALVVHQPHKACADRGFQPEFQVQ